MEKCKEEKKLTDKLSLTLRLLVAGYLIYLAVSLCDVFGHYTGAELIIYVVAIVLFFLTGLGLGGISVYCLATGKYIGGKMDKSSQEHISEEK